MMGEACDDAFRLFVSLCKDKYPGLPPELVPIAKKYGVNVAYKVRDYLLRQVDVAKAMEYEFENPNSMFHKYVMKMSELLGEPPDSLLKSEAVRKYFEALKGLR